VKGNQMLASSSIITMEVPDYCEREAAVTAKAQVW